MNKSRYYPGLDLIRGLSAIFILLYHYTTRYNDNPITCGGRTEWIINVPWGCAAVTTFFILSGFLTSKHILNNTVGGGWMFLRHRILRLYPALTVCMILTFIVTNICFKQAAGDLKDLLFSFTLMPQVFGAKYIDGAYWTLRIEFMFYIFIAFLMYLPIGYKKICICALCLLSIMLYPIDCLYGHNAIIRAMIYIVNPSWVSSFMAGMSIFFLINNRRDYFFQVIMLLSVLSTILWQDTYHNIFFAATCLLLIAATCLDMSILQRFRLSGLLMWYGKISYPLYLIHQLIGFAIIYYLQIYGYTSTWFIIIPITVSSFLGWLVHTYVELPISRLFIKS